MANHQKLQLCIFFVVLISTVHSEHWYDIGVMGIMTKPCNICAVAMYTSIQPIICRFITSHTKPYIIQTLELFCSIEGWIYPNHERYGIGNELFMEPIKYSSWKIIGDIWNISSWKIFNKPGHDQFGYIIYLHVYLISPIK